MPVFVAKEITSIVAGQRIEAVKCEKCGTAFYYELTRVGVGKGSAPYLIGQTSASNRAAAAAKRETGSHAEKGVRFIYLHCRWHIANKADKSP